jgi:4-amino-4-deoxy-L-arabinose transferase-like glycosyltransferase
LKVLGLTTHIYKSYKRAHLTKPKWVFHHVFWVSTQVPTSKHAPQLLLILIIKSFNNVTNHPTNTRQILCVEQGTSFPVHGYFSPHVTWKRTYSSPTSPPLILLVECMQYFLEDGFTKSWQLSLKQSNYMLGLPSVIG